MAGRERRDALPVDFHNDREHRKKLAERTNQIEQELRDDTGAGLIGVDASGFSGNLATTDDDLQKVADKVDALVLGGDLDSDAFDANTILAADADNTPTARTIAENRLVGRKTGGTIGALTASEISAILGGSVPGALLVHAEDQKASGTAGGTFTSGADRTRDINTLVYNRDSIASLSSNQITLPAGNYEIEWWANAYRVEEHQSFLYNVTDSAEVKRGSTVNGDNSASTPSTVSHGIARVSIAGSKAFEIRHRCSSTGTTNGYGAAASFGTEVYLIVKIRRG